MTQDKGQVPAIQRFEVVDCIDSKHVPAVIPKPHGPSVAVALSDDLRDSLVAISEAVADQDDRAAQAMLREILKAPQPSPTAQTDSVPAIQGEMNVQLDIDSNHSAPGQQRDVARSVALGQPMGNGQDQAAGRPSAQGDKLLTVAERNIRRFLRSAQFKCESDREAALNCVDVLWAAARDPADSQPAPDAWLVTGIYTKQAFPMHCSAMAFLNGLLSSDPDGGYKIVPLFIHQQTTAGACGCEEPPTNPGDTESGPEGEWYCETHPSQLMGHAGCGGAGIPACGRIPCLMNQLRLTKQQVRETGHMRDEMAAAVLRAARAQADSVTAPAGPSKSLPYEPTSAMLIAARERDPALPIETVRAIYWSMWRTAPTPPAQAADSVLEDAARLDWLAPRLCAYDVSAPMLNGQSGPAIMFTWPIGVDMKFADLRGSIDAARKQGGTHDNH